MSVSVTAIRCLFERIGCKGVFERVGFKGVLERNGCTRSVTAARLSLIVTAIYMGVFELNGYMAVSELNGCKGVLMHARSAQRVYGVAYPCHCCTVQKPVYTVTLMPSNLSPKQRVLHYSPKQG